jgi:hypothetical protein
MCFDVSLDKRQNKTVFEGFVLASGPPGLK